MLAGHYLSAILCTLCLVACRADVPSVGSQQLAVSEGFPQSEIIDGARQSIERAVGAKMELGKDVIGVVLHKGMTSTTPVQSSSPPSTPPRTTAAIVPSSSGSPTTTTATQPPSSTPASASSTPAKSTTLPQTTAITPTTPLPTSTAQVTTSPQATTPPSSTPPPSTPPPSTTPMTTIPPGQCLALNTALIPVDNSTCAPAASGGMACPTSTTFCSTTYLTEDVTPGTNVTAARINSQCNGMGGCSTTNGTEALVCNAMGPVINQNCMDAANVTYTVSCGTITSGLGQILYQSLPTVGNCTSDVDCVTVAGAGPNHACVAITATESQCVLPGPISQSCETTATSCFPPDALVRLKGGQVKKMEHVRVGDLLQSISPDGFSVYEEVYMIAHDDPNTVATFVTLHHADEDGGNPGIMKLTPDHYIAVGVSWAEHSMQPARTLHPGMHIFSASSKDGPVTSHVITKVERILQRGIYAPFTMNGILVVDSVVASSHVELNRAAAASLQMLNIDPTAVLQLATGSARLLYRVFGARLAIHCNTAECAIYCVVALDLIMLCVTFAVAHAVVWWVLNSLKGANSTLNLSMGRAEHGSIKSMLKA